MHICKGISFMNGRVIGLLSPMLSMVLVYSENKLIIAKLTLWVWCLQVLVSKSLIQWRRI